MTELRAFGPVTTAFGKMKRLLLEPLDIGLWIKLVIITFFVGSGSGSFNPGSNLRYILDRSDVNNLPYHSIQDVLADTMLVTVILVLVLAAVALVLLLSYLRGVFSFVLVEALTSGNVRIIQPFKDNMGRGFKAFLFNVAMSIISLAVILSTLAVMVLAVLWAVGREGVSTPSTPGIFILILTIIIGIVFLISFSILIGLVVGFFYDFAVPLMYFKGMGLRQAIGTVVGMVRKDPLEFLVYVVLRWVLELVVSLVLGIILLFFVAIFVAAGVIVVIAMIEAAKINLVLAVLFGLVILAGLLLMTIVTAIISLPVNVYFRYYSLDFLKTMDPAAVIYSGRFG